MTKKDDRLSPEASPRRPARTGQPDPAFDVWLERGLHRLFDEVANEPIPEALLELIEKHRGLKE